MLSSNLVTRNKTLFGSSIVVVESAHQSKSVDTTTIVHLRNDLD